MASVSHPHTDKVGLFRTPGTGPSPGHSPVSSARGPTSANIQVKPPTVVPPAAPMKTMEKPAAMPEKKSSDITAKKVPDGAGPAVGAPKPVEVITVPQTPIDSSTPAGASPRPELNLAPPPQEQGKSKESSKEPAVITGVQPPTTMPITSAPEEKDNVTEKEEAVTKQNEKDPKYVMTGALPSTEHTPKKEGDKKSSLIGAIGEKRKATEEADVNGPVPSAQKTEQHEKRAKLNGGMANGKPKKQRKPLSQPGKTARKTRSQGPVDA